MMEKKKGPPTEADTRRRILADCNKYYGPEAQRQLKMVFDKYDRLLANCGNQEERKQIKILALTEIYKKMGYQDGLQVGGTVILEADVPKKDG